MKKIIEDRDLGIGDGSKFFVRCVKWFTGIDDLNELYGRVVSRGGDFASGTLEELRIRVDEGGYNLGDILPERGGAVIVSNLRHGFLDALVLLWSVQRYRNRVKILAPRILTEIPELRDYIVAQPDGYKDKVGAYRVRREIEQLLEENGVLITFPASEVAKKSTLFSAVRESDWEKRTIRAVRICRRPIIPVYIDGRNSYWYYVIRMIGNKLARLRLGKELLKKSGGSVKVVYSSAIDPDLVAGLKSANETRVLIKATTRIAREIDLERNSAENATLEVKGGEVEGSYIDPLLLWSASGKQLAVVDDMTLTSIERSNGVELVVSCSRDNSVLATCMLSDVKSLMESNEGIEELNIYKDYEFSRKIDHIMERSVEIGEVMVSGVRGRESSVSELLFKGIIMLFEGRDNWQHLLHNSRVGITESRTSLRLIINYLKGNYYTSSMEGSITPRHKTYDLSQPLLKGRSGWVVTRPDVLTQFIKEADSKAELCSTVSRMLLEYGGEFCCFSRRLQGSGNERVQGLIIRSKK